jgi:hypothetical protein
MEISKVIATKKNTNSTIPDTHLKSIIPFGNTVFFPEGKTHGPPKSAL